MTGTTALLRRLDAIKNQVDKTRGEAVRLARGYAMKMTGDYANASNEPEDISVYVEDLPDGCNIIGGGEDILFVEFGTGIIYPRTNPIDHPYNFAGSWSIEHAQYLTDSEKLARHKGQWPYNGKWVDGQPSANVFYEAGKTIRDELPDYLVEYINRALK